ncbi:MAG: 1-deoxy-D-xylulose-5-phosphate synthase N-terminal domain-containing protein, partial [Ancrocorticia populi]
MRILDSIQNPADVKKLTQPELDDLAAEIRQFLVENVSRTGGHLGPNLGVVELTIALHRIFDSPADSLVFDTGHQSYVHKLLTGRHDFSHLRQSEGLSGYPNRAESKHDIVENSHASTALSWADGIARAKQLRRDPHCVVAVIGDGAMTGGMVWEALNNISEDPERPIVIVLNDNGRSYAPTVGGMVRRFEGARKLDAVRVNRSYEMFMEWTKRTLQDAGAPGKMAYGALHSIKRGVKDIFVDAGIFDSLGIKYVGPVDGHDVEELEQAFTLAKEYGGPVVVHAITEKGRGYKPAEDDVADRFHAIGKIHPETGLQVAPARFGWTSIFAEHILKLAYENPRIIGVTAAMLRPVGLGPLANEFPDRVIDVGIAEQHAITMAAGLGYQGMHPVVALYATFLNRGFDQML